MVIGMHAKNHYLGVKRGPVRRTDFAELLFYLGHPNDTLASYSEILYIVENRDSCPSAQAAAERRSGGSLPEILEMQFREMMEEQNPLEVFSEDGATNSNLERTVPCWIIPPRLIH
jgi:hypothetical protein